MRVTDSGSAWDSPFEMVNYPDVTHGNQLSIGHVSVSASGDVLISAGVSAHVIVGGHASISFNVSEFYRRLFGFE